KFLSRGSGGTCVMRVDLSLKRVSYCNTCSTLELDNFKSRRLKEDRLYEISSSLFGFHPGSISLHSSLFFVWRRTSGTGIGLRHYLDANRRSRRLSCDGHGPRPTALLPANGRDKSEGARRSGVAVHSPKRLRTRI